MTQDTPPPGERIAKVIARSGRASRRDAEALIIAGRVAVNGQIIARAALNVTPGDRITIDGTPLDAPEPARLWLYHKPAGLVTTTRDEQGRPTIYDDLPEDMPRVMSVGRLDLNSEGLLLLTNDGALKRRLELPATGWLRKYRVRVNGRVTDPMLEPLRRGITSDGQSYQPMIVTLDRQQGANAWLTVGLREGKNREIRRAMTEIGLSVNRLIRVSYGPFQLAQLKPGAVEEVRRRVLRDQLGEPGDDSAEGGESPPRPKVTRRGTGNGTGSGTGRGAAGKAGGATAGRAGGPRPKGARDRAEDWQSGPAPRPAVSGRAAGKGGGGKGGTGKASTGKASTGKASMGKASMGTGGSGTGGSGTGATPRRGAPSGAEGAAGRKASPGARPRATTGQRGTGPAPKGPRGRR